jgi:sensor histidine kinase regulating citrate/malate metabolism
MDPQPEDHIAKDNTEQSLTPLEKIDDADFIVVPHPHQEQKGHHPNPEKIRVKQNVFVKRKQL